MFETMDIDTTFSFYVGGHLSVSSLALAIKTLSLLAYHLLCCGYIANFFSV